MSHAVRSSMALDNHLVGSVTVDSHPVYNSASLSIRSGKIYRTVTLVADGGASIMSIRVPTQADVRYEGSQR